MFNLSATLSQLKDQVLRKPVEIHDIYLGDQTAEDENTLHFVFYYSQINFFTYLGGIEQSYQPLAMTRSGIKKGSKGEIDRVNYKVDNVTRAMTDYAAAIDFRNKRIVTRLIFRDHLDDAENAKVVFDGIIQNITFEESDMVASCVPIISSLSFETGWPYQINCNAKFGDGFCGVDKNSAANRKVGVATGGTTATLIDTATLVQTDDYWNIGEILMTSGDNSGSRRKIIDFDQATATLTFDFEMNSSIQAGDEYVVYRGCDKRLTTCTTIFNNDANYRGFHAIPLNESNT
jgi:uncharacterized phage protein (TIGR02218 family)